MALVSVQSPSHMQGHEILPWHTAVVTLLVSMYSFVVSKKSNVHCSTIHGEVRLERPWRRDTHYIHEEAIVV